MIQDDTRDRVIAVERDLVHVRDKLDDVAEMVTDMHNTMQRGRGALWTALGAWSVIVGIVSANAGTLWSKLTGH